MLFISYHSLSRSIQKGEQNLGALKPDNVFIVPTEGLSATMFKV